MLRTAPRTHTRAHTHSHSHSRALVPTHTRLTPAPTTRPRHRRRVPNRLFDSAIFFFLFNFQFAFAGLPPLQRGKQTLLPAGSFRSCWVLLWGGERARRPCFSVPAFPGSGARNPPSCGRGPGARRGAGAGRGHRPLPALGSTRFPARARGPGLASAALALLPEGRKFTLCSGLNSERGGSSLRRAPLPPTLPLLLGPHRGMGCLWEFGAARRWGLCWGARA